MASDTSTSIVPVKSKRRVAFYCTLAVMVAAVVASAAVWQSAEKKRRSEVQGVVLRAGEPIPLADCRVTFINAELGLFAPATLNADGTYRVQTHQHCKLPPGVCNECGLLPGTYQVVVSFPNEFLPESISRTEPLPAAELETQLARFIPKKFRDPETSGLTLTLTGGDAVFNIDMRE